MRIFTIEPKSAPGARRTISLPENPSTGIGIHKDDKNKIKGIKDQFTAFVGQYPKYNLSKKAVSAFKLRIGQTVGLTSTLRGKRMYGFIGKIVNAVLPRVRDFRGIPLSSLDGSGNISIAIREHSIMPEIKFEDAGDPFGFQINIKTSAKNNNDAKILLEKLGFPFERNANHKSIKGS